MNQFSILRRRLLTLASGAPLAALLPRGAAAQATGEPIRIGLSAAITGQFAQNGYYMRNGVTLGVNEVNAAGGVNGRPLKLYIEDDQGPNPTAAVNAMNKLVNQDEVIATIGPHNTPAVLPVLPMLAQYHVPALTGASGPVVTQQNNPWIFRIRLNDEIGAALLVDYMLDKLGCKKIGLAYVSTSFGQGGIKMVHDALVARGVQPVLEQAHQISVKDFTANLMSFQQAQVDGVIVWSDDQPAGLFVKQAKTLGMTFKVAGSTGLSQPAFIALASDAAEGVMAVTDFAPDNPSPEAKSWIAKYTAAYKEPPELFASAYYDALYILVGAMRRASAMDGPAIREALTKTSGMVGVTNTYSWTATGDMVKQGFITRNQNGKPVIASVISR